MQPSRPRVRATDQNAVINHMRITYHLAAADPLQQQTPLKCD